jgi:hypothetical protein
MPDDEEIRQSLFGVQNVIVQQRLEGLTHSREVVNYLERAARGEIPVRERLSPTLARGTGIKVEKLCEQLPSSLAPSLIPKRILEAAFGPPFLCLETVNETEKARLNQFANSIRAFILHSKKRQKQNKNVQENSLRKTKSVF